jgi:uncharacterized protein YkwD
MSKLRKVLLGFVAIVTAVTLVAVEPVSADELSDESEFVARINELRASQGIGPLEVHSRLTQMGRDWSLNMALADGISHNPALAAWAPSDWTRLGENVGVGGSVASLHDAFVTSPAHYRNLVDPQFRYVGIGIVYDDGRIYVTQQFMTTSGTPVMSVAAAQEPAPEAKAAPAKKTKKVKKAKAKKAKARRR